MSNWKTPGPDGVLAFCFKKIRNLNDRLAKHLQACLNTVVPPWMTKGRTVLMMKDNKKGRVASNDRPIACLPIMWKLLTGVLVMKFNVTYREIVCCRINRRVVTESLERQKTCC